MMRRANRFSTEWIKEYLEDDDVKDELWVRDADATLLESTNDMLRRALLEIRETAKAAAILMNMKFIHEVADKALVRLKGAR